ncbi:uncharacterized protein J7T54_003008 [Emericellopsis cladophorae]|uniref:DUF5597 domain-containing protein n=1 Tax=Emericellopsis cladophorae TaxID=2686198 RepID=A0A9Q0BDJ1_9HYPO|nr:uncharacterized protein J7T54_003008 [Emericellopsis cladophorae]KAI6780229.1 hypothetical protein J7T54_003008 [Emericellopsis cladophorae]
MHNSSLSSAEYMSSKWGDLKAANFNTVLGSVPCESIEPEEGVSDFSHVDKAILELKPIDLCEAAWEADARAFSTLMRHIKEIDAAHSTVLMIQVQNECRVLGDSRDRSKLAEKVFAQPVPLDLLGHLAGKQHLNPKFEKRWPRFRNTVSLDVGKTWQQVFGKGNATDGLFMAHSYASYIGKVAQAGKEGFPLPFFTNVWLSTDDESLLDIRDIADGIGMKIVACSGHKPGIYPSGGPCPHTLDVWKCCVPGLHLIAPNVYLQKYEWACKQYRYDNQPLLIPERRIDTIEAAKNDFKKPYGLLDKMSDHILATQANHPEDMFDFFFDEPSRTARASWVRSMGIFTLHVIRSFVFENQSPGYGIFIPRGQGRFLLIGEGFQVKFGSQNPDAS